MPTRIHGSPTGFWDGTTTFNQVTNPGGGLTVGVGGTSKPQNIARGNDEMMIYVTVSAATTVTVEVGHHGAPTAEGSEPDAATPPATFHQLHYTSTATPVQLVFAGAGSFAIQIPDIAFNWIRLRTSAAANITAGWEASGD